jgi:hypothetical protein
VAAQGSRTKSCEEKNRYTKREARGVVNAAKGAKLRAYPCRYCHGWHVGHPLGSDGYPRR